VGYTVIDDQVFRIGSDWSLNMLGRITPGRINNVSMIDNGATIVIVDGSSNGYTIDLLTNAFAPINDPTGIFQGGIRADYMDTFLLFNTPNSNEFVSTLSNAVSFDPTYFAFKTAYPDNMQALIVNMHEIYMIGTLKTELWQNLGLAQFPFAILQGVYHEHGTVAPYSVASMDQNVYMLGQDLQGQGVVWKLSGYSSIRISSHAVEESIRRMYMAGTIADAIGYTYQQGGHMFYVLHFPSGDETWVYDEVVAQSQGGAASAWHQEGWTDPATGVLHRHRANCHALINGRNVVGDWQNGTIYYMDFDTYTDTVDGVVCPMQYLRTFPHISYGEIEQGILGRRPMIVADGRRVQFKEFMLDIESGLAPHNGDDNLVILRYSDDRGRTYSSDVLQRGGNLGEYLTRPTWMGLGIARDRIFEVEYSFGPAALNGAWIDATVLES